MIVSTLSFSKLSDLIGRKYTILFLAVPYFLAWLLIALARSIYVFYASRILSGVADGCFFTAVPAYIGEISTPKVRGQWGNAMSFYIYLGRLLINILGGFCSVPLTAYVCMTVPVLFAVLFAFMPESPYYCMMKGKCDEAKASLRRLRRKNDVEKEFAQLKADVERQMSETGTWKDLVTIQSNRKALVSGIFLRISQQLGGMAAFTFYTQYIFKEAGGNLDARTSAIIFSFFCTVTNFCSGITLDRLGRRKAYLLSLISCATVLLVIAVYFYLDKEVATLDLTALNWLPITGMVAFVFAFSVGMGIVPTLMLGELFSASVKSKGLSVVIATYGIMLSIVSEMFHLLQTSAGLYAPYLFFSVCCLINSPLALHFVPETRGKTLEEIQQTLKKSNNKNASEEVIKKV